MNAELKDILSNDDLNEDTLYQFLKENKYSFDEIISEDKSFVIYDLHGIGIAIYKNGGYNQFIKSED